MPTKLNDAGELVSVPQCGQMWRVYPNRYRNPETPSCRPTIDSSIGGGADIKRWFPGKPPATTSRLAPDPARLLAGNPRRHHGADATRQPHQSGPRWISRECLRADWERGVNRSAHSPDCRRGNYHGSRGGVVLQRPAPALHPFFLLA
jgi:hypothetical protein